ncbi:MAG TPA: TMEM175 family protein [Candidatus Krumholzibacteria bacterium]|nr:TMEM175 family protein [Candidatus Krumholzibacteria bacterium]
MNTSRLEAFSDGVIAILITIMVLEFHTPHEATLAALRPLLPLFLSYLLSFVFLGIYWTNHHHLMHMTERVSGSVLWANLHLLFWLSLIPFTTVWMSEHYHEALPVAAYGLVDLGAGIAYSILYTRIVRHEANVKLHEAVGADWKGRASHAAYALAVVLAFVWTPLSIALYAIVALAWLVPDRRIEKKI